MRSFSHFCRKCIAVFVLVMALSCSAFAGDVQFPGVTSSPPATMTGEIPCPGAASPLATDGEIPFPGVAADSIEVTALTLWQSVLAFF